MAMAVHIRARVDPWDDPAFVKAFERALEAVEAADTPDGEAGPEVERLLHEAGFPRATVFVERTANEALAHTARWVVRRDG